MRRLVVAALSVGACASAEAGASAYFLGTSVYATDEGCVKLKALAAGEPKNVGTVPETLTSQGFKSWEGGCAFGSIQERRRHKLYVSRMTCFEGPDRWLEKNSFSYVPGKSNCFMIDVKRPGAEFFGAMQKEKVFIGRTWPAWPTHVRVTVGTQEEMDKFKAAFVKVMG